MDLDNESTSDSEDEMDSCSLQYQIADPNLLGTAVFIRHVQVDADPNVLVYVHEEPEMIQKHYINIKWISTIAATVLAVSTVILVGSCVSFS